MTLHHVALETRSADVEAELAFWGLLGFAPAAVPEALRGRTAWLARGATQVHLLVAEDAAVPRAGHAAVVLGDYDATLAALRAAGHPVEDRARHWGAPRAFVRSPGGHRVEVMAAPPA